MDSRKLIASVLIVAGVGLAVLGLQGPQETPQAPAPPAPVQPDVSPPPQPAPEPAPKPKPHCPPHRPWGPRGEAVASAVEAAPDVTGLGWPRAVVRIVRILCRHRR